MKELRIEARVGNINIVTDFVNEFLETMDCPMKAQLQIDMAIDELFSNIASYAYPEEDGEAVVRVEEGAGPRSAIVTFMDRGIPYDPLAKPDPDITLSAEEREIGGLGIFLVKKTMDEVRYAREDGMNVLQIRKNLPEKELP